MTRATMGGMLGSRARGVQAVPAARLALLLAIMAPAWAPARAGPPEPPAAGGSAAATAPEADDVPGAAAGPGGAIDDRIDGGHDEERGSQPEPPAEVAPEDPEPGSPIDRGHERIGAGLINLLDRVDRYFADDNYTGLTNESFIRLAPGLRIRQGPDFGFKLRVKAALQLPNTQNRLGLVLQGRDEDDDSLDGGLQDDDSFTAGLRAALLDRGRTKLRLSIGSRFRPEPDPFVRLRLQRVLAWERFAIRPSVTAYWELEDGVGERTRADLDYALDPRSILRLRGEATYGQSTAGVEFRTSIQHVFALRDRSAWLIRLRMDAHTRPRTEVTGYRAEIRYRWSMLRKWLFFEIEPGLRLEREDDWDPAPEVTFRVEVVFGKLRKLGLFDRSSTRSAMLPASGPWTPSSSRASGRLLSRLP